MTKEFHKQVLEAMLKVAEEKGLEIVSRVCPFKNNDVPKFLKKLKRFEEESRKSRLMISGSYSSSNNYYSINYSAS